MIVDTDILVDLARGDPRAIGFLDDLIGQGERPVVSVVTEMELFMGARTRGEQRSVRQVVQRFQVLPISEMVSLRARNLVVRYAASHGLTIPDALIAATAIGNQALFLTKNARHFSYLPQLRVRAPYA